MEEVVLYLVIGNTVFLMVVDLVPLEWLKRSQAVAQTPRSRK